MYEFQWKETDAIDTVQILNPTETSEERRVTPNKATILNPRGIK